MKHGSIFVALLTIATSVVAALLVNDGTTATTEAQSLTQVQRTPVVVRDGKLDYTTTARALGEVCKDLEEALGIVISPRGVVVKEPVVVHVTDVTLDELLGKLAEATSCEVLKSNTGYVLERTVATDRKLKDELFQDRLESVKKGYRQLERALAVEWKRETLVQLAKERFKSESHDERLTEAEEEAKQERWRELRYYGPSPRALGRCLASIDPMVLAKMRIGDRLVFTTSPTAMQRPIGNGAKQAMALINSEQELWGTSLREAAGDDTERFSDDMMIGAIGDEDFFGFNDDPWSRTLPFRSVPVALRLAIGYRWYGSYEVDLIGIDKDGKTSFRYEADGLFYDYEGWDTVASESNDYDVALSPASTAWETVSVGPFEDERRPTKEEIARNRAILARYYGESPAADPLALVASDTFIGLAKRDDLDAVACFSDEFNTLYDMTDGKKASTKRFEALLKAAKNHVTKREDGWLTVKPAKHELVTLTRFDRTAFRRMMQSVHRSGHCSIEASAEFYANAGETPLYTDASYIMRTVFESDIADANGNGSVMSFYSRLTSQQRKWLAEGNTLTVSQLDAEQRRWAATVVFGADNGGNYMMEGAGRSAGWNADITDELPQGLLPTSRIKGKQFEQTYIQFVNKSAKEFRVFWTENMENAGKGRFWSGPPPTYPSQAEKVTEYIVRRNHRVEVRIETTPDVFFGNDVTDDLPYSEAKTVKFEALTEAERKVVEAGWKELKSFGIVWDGD